MGQGQKEPHSIRFTLANILSKPIPEITKLKRGEFLDDIIFVFMFEKTFFSKFLFTFSFDDWLLLIFISLLISLIRKSFLLKY